jgi:hypothetical protein
MARTGRRRKSRVRNVARSFLGNVDGKHGRARGDWRASTKEKEILTRAAVLMMEREVEVLEKWRVGGKVSMDERTNVW